MSKSFLHTIFFYEFMLGYNTVQTARNINKVWGEDVAMQCTVQFWYKKFRSGNTSLEDESHGSRLSTIGDNQLKGHVEADPWTDPVRALLEELNVRASTVVI